MESFIRFLVRFDKHVSLSFVVAVVIFNPIAMANGMNVMMIAVTKICDKCFAPI